MKHRIRLTCVLLGAMAFIVGCRDASESSDAEQPRQRSSAELLADGITGRYAIEAGKRAKSDIEEISQQHNARLEEVLGE